MEQTFIMIKPDGVQRGLVGEIIPRFEKKGFFLKEMAMMSVDQGFAGKHYEDLAKHYIWSWCLLWYLKANNVITTGRKIIGGINSIHHSWGSLTFQPLLKP